MYYVSIHTPHGDKQKTHRGERDIDIPRRGAKGAEGDDIDLTSTRKHIYTKHVVVSQREPEREVDGERKRKRWMVREPERDGW